MAQGPATWIVVAGVLLVLSPLIQLLATGRGVGIPALVAAVLLGAIGFGVFLKVYRRAGRGVSR